MYTVVFTESGLEDMADFPKADRGLVLDATIEPIIPRTDGANPQSQAPAPQ
jgi:hypothetical protein